MGGSRPPLADLPRKTHENALTWSDARLRQHLHALIGHADPRLLRLLVKVVETCTRLQRE